MRAMFRWVRHAFELAGAIQMMVAVGSSAVVGGVVAGAFDVAWPLRVVAFFGVGLLVSAVVLALWRAFDGRTASSSHLASRLDALLRDGVALLHRLPSGAEPAEASNEYTLLLLPPPAVVEQVGDFDERVRELLTEQRPSLLTYYAEGFNSFLRRSREKAETVVPDSADDRSDEAKLKGLADHAHRQPAMYLEACLEGLAAARNQLGH